MADEKAKPAEAPRVEVSVSRPTSVSSEAGSGVATTTSLDSATHEVDPSGGLGPEDQDDPLAKELEGELETEGSETPADEEKPEGDLEPLPDYDPANEEVAAQYDARYFDSTGKLNEAALTAEFDASGDKETINESTFKYLEDRLGLSRETIEKAQRGLNADRKAEAATVLAPFGGPEGYEKARAWAKGGGYSEARQKAFNAALDAGGETRAMALEALASGFSKANPGALGTATSTENKRPGLQRRPSSPKRDVTGGARNPGGEGGERLTGANYGQKWGEALKAVKEAQATGDKAKVRAAEAARDALRSKARRQGLA